MRRFLVCSALSVLFVPGVASAQQPATPATVRGYLIGGVGTSLGGPQPTLTLSAEVAERIPMNMQFYFGINYFDDVMTDDARDAIAASGAALTAVSGVPWEFAGRDKARSFTLGLKYSLPVASGVRPYVGAGFGMVNLKRTIRDARRGDVTEAYLAQFGGPNGVVDSAQTNTNRPLGELSGGIALPIQKVYIDIGYRYRHAFHTGEASLNLSQVGVGVGLRF